MGVYLTSYSVPGKEECREFLEYHVPKEQSYRVKLNIWDDNERYPFDFFEKTKKFTFDNLTIFYGNNGCGKSTILNLIASSLKLQRRSDVNTSPFFNLFCDNLCKVSTHSDFDDIGRQAEIITSDDVFKHILLLRERNKTITKERNSAIDYIFEFKAAHSRGDYVPPHQANSIDECIERSQLYRQLKQSSSYYVRKHSSHNMRNHSNGESALEFFTSVIKDDGLYLLDEPENSLSPSFQIQLIKYLRCSLKLGCQFVIATHSPFLLGIPGAKIYNLDDPEMPVVKWSELENIQIYYQFFKQHEEELSGNDK